MTNIIIASDETHFSNPIISKSLLHKINSHEQVKRQSSDCNRSSRRYW